MKKGKFDIAKLDLSNNVEMIKTDEGTQELVEKAIQVIHNKEEVKAEGRIKKFTFDMPEYIFKEAKHYIVEAEISMKDYIISLMAKDLEKRGKIKPA